jgi:thioredoxin-related protein
LSAEQSIFIRKNKFILQLITIKRRYEIPISLLSLFLFKLSPAQLNFSEIPFTNALQKARSEGKIIFLQFEAANCNQCNDVANKGFENKELADKINKTFFCLKINAQHPDRNKIAITYNMKY